MTQQPPPAQYQAPYAPGSPAPKQGNGLGLAALIIGILAFIGAFIPIVNYVSGVLALVGLVLGVIGLFRKGRPKGLAITGTIISLIALILSIILAITYTVGFATAIDQGIKDVQATQSAEANVDVAVTYEIVGDSTDATVTYSTYNDGNFGTEQATGQTLPFAKDFTVKAGGQFDYQSFTLTGSNGQTGGDITCRITIDGVVAAEQTATGQYASATCSSSGFDN
ncbi:MmpS family transport accessory protein [Agreia bicolorata]|nr:MmpS family transport accessory protein [Agreia bicolorata]